MDRCNAFSPILTGIFKGVFCYATRSAFRNQLDRLHYSFCNLNKIVDKLN